MKRITFVLLSVLFVAFFATAANSYADELTASDFQKASTQSGNDYITFFSPGNKSKHPYNGSMKISFEVSDTYEDCYTLPVVYYVKNDEAIDIEEVEIVDYDSVDTYTWNRSLKGFAAGTYKLVIMAMPCDEEGNIVDDWEEYDVPYIERTFYIYPTGTVTIKNTIANSAARSNDVIWDKSKVKGATNYQINWRARGASKWATRNVGNVIRGKTTGLTVGNLYEIRVRPYSSGVYGNWSNYIYRYFHTTQKIRLKSNSKGSFTMSWQKNPKATAYQVMFTTNKNGAGAAKNINTVGPNATSFTKKGLQSGRTYYVQIREIRRVGAINYIGNISTPVAVKVK